MKIVKNALAIQLCDAMDQQKVLLNGDANVTLINIKDMLSK